MAVMKITRRWWDILYPYRVEWDDAYKLHSTQAVWGTLESHKTQGPYYVMTAATQHFLEDLPKASFLGIKRPACLYQYKTGRQPFVLISEGGRLRTARKPPAILMARKGDALMLKLACAGRD